MIPGAMILLVEAQARATAAAPACSPAKDGAQASADIWTRLRPLAYLAPLAVNWPGGKPAF
jgi:hypothetical protein